MANWITLLFLALGIMRTLQKQSLCPERVTMYFSTNLAHVLSVALAPSI